LEFEILSLVFLIAAEIEMKFEMPSEMENGTAQSCRSGKELRKCKRVETQNVDNNSSTPPKYHNFF
jgi:hypothetical protein